MKKVCFERFEETRWNAFLHINELCDELGISERTYYRWKADKQAPKWAYKAVKRCTGELTIFGWKGWRIENGVLYCDGVSHKHHNWTPKDLLVPLFTPPKIIDGKPNLRLINGCRDDGVNREEQRIKEKIDKTRN